MGDEAKQSQEKIQRQDKARQGETRQYSNTVRAVYTGHRAGASALPTPWPAPGQQAHRVKKRPDASRLDRQQTGG